MYVGDWISTPRFCNVKIEQIFICKEEAFGEKFAEPTYYEDDRYDVYGKSTDIHTMEFAAVKK